MSGPSRAELWRFSRYCGPRSLAALTGRDPLELAFRLWHVQADEADAGGEPPDFEHVRPVELVDVLVELGCGVELWIPTDPPERLGPVGRGGRAIPPPPTREPTPSDVLSPAELAAVRAEVMAELEAAPPPPPRRLTVTEWARLAPEGRWLLATSDHAMAADGGHVLNVIDPAAPLADAYRITPPKHPPRRNR